MGSDANEAIAIIGSACRFPGNGDSPSKLWQVLRDPPDLCSLLPPSRFHAAGFYHGNPAYHGHSNVLDMKSYFLSEQSVESRFDAAFFAITPAEAAVLDPQVRLLLETTWEALEAAGQTMDSLQGSDTGCYVGLMMGEYEVAMLRDPETISKYHITGTARSLISNRLSYFFDWHGPSMTIDTACSSSLVAVHQAVQLLRSHQARLAVAAGSNLILDPITHVSESKLQMLSPDGRGRMWDAGANGYARGEGVATLVLKRLSDAISDGDDIECIIRETGVNQDGKTRGITMPSSKAQAALIRETYRKAGLDPTNPRDRPQYFEAHGTGTPAGDPVEAEAIHSAFFMGGDAGHGHQAHQPLLVGSIKTVLGHSEGTAGIAAILKASLALQQSTIPPNLLLDNLNPRIEPFCAQLRVPTAPMPWPMIEAGQPRRASVNSFGFGGTNAHAILESWDKSASCSDSTTAVFGPFVFSAASEKSLKAYLESFALWLEANAQETNLGSLAHTLHARRSRLQYAIAIAARDAADLCAKIHTKVQAPSSGPEDPWSVRSRPERERGPVILGVFTGQGAQWPAMGAELLSKSGVARDIISTLERRLARLPFTDRPPWSLLEEMQRPVDCSRVAEATLSQPVCTAVQIVLVDILRSSGIEFSAVVGHSSGEIAAAYAAGMISAEDAICIAYYRGLHSHLAAGRDGQEGAMMAVGVTVDDASELVDSHVFQGRAVIAAYNSSNSLTLSGDADAIEDLKIIIEDEQKFARLLRVEKAYHSHHIRPCAGPYGDSLRRLDIQVSSHPKCPWISSVSGDDISKHGSEKVNGQYWVENAVKPVLFMQAVQRACQVLGATSDINLAIEVGPHPALRGPTIQTIQETTGQTTPYTGLLKRKASDLVSLADGLGFAWTHLPKDHVNLESFDHFMSGDTPVRLIKGLPKYSWDHDVEYWHQSRYAKSCLFRAEPHELLGHLTSALGVGQELKWRQILSPAEVPWLNGHRLQDQSVFPAAAYVVLALEACREHVKLSPDLDAGSVALIRVQNVEIHQAMTFDSDVSRVEAFFSLRNITREGDVVSASFAYFGGPVDATRGPEARGGSTLRMLASGSVEIVLGKPCHRALPPRGPRPDNTLPVKADEFYESLRLMGYEYSGPFRALSGLERKLGAVSGWLSHGAPEEQHGSELLVHPAMLDVAFQAVLLAKAAPYDGTLWSMHVPKTIKRVTVNPSACQDYMTRRDKPLPFDSCQPSILDNTFRGDVDVYPPRAVGTAGSIADEVSHAIIQVEGLDCVPFSRATAEDDREPMSVMVWDYASPDAEKAAHDLSPEPDPQELALAQFLERLSFFYLQRLQRLVPSDHPCRGDGMPLSKLFNFAKHIESRVVSGKVGFWKDEWFQDTPETIREASGPYADKIDYRLLSRIGENLVEIAKGETTAIEITRSDDVLSEYYASSLIMGRHTTFLARTVKQITHRHPHLNILEVGAGTGVATKEVLSTIGNSFSSYTFTDISSGFFPAAQEYFGAQPSFPRMTFKVLDIGSDPREQGFEAHAYDVVVSSMVLHATPALRQALRNTRRLLKPGGYLVVHEVVDNDVARCGTIFGAFPGWWLGAEGDGRVLGPALPLARWHELLRETGFSGCDSSVPIIDPLLTPNAVFVSQAVDARTDFLRAPLSVSSPAQQEILKSAAMHEVILIGGSSATTSQVTLELRPLLQAHFGSVRHVPSLADIAAHDVPMTQNTTVLSLSDVDAPFCQNVTDVSLQSLKQVLNSADSVLWVTQGRQADNPFVNMTVGLVRSVLIEVPTLAFQFLDFEDVGGLRATVIAEALVRFKVGLAWKQERDGDNRKPAMLMTVERELEVDKQGQVLIPRMFPAKDMNERYNSGMRPIFRTTQLGREGQIDKSLVLSQDKDRRDFYLEEDEKVAHPESLQVTHSLLLSYWIKDLGHAHISLVRDKDDASPRILLSGHVASAMRPLTSLPPLHIEGGEALLKDCESKGRFLVQFALNMLAISIIADVPRGERLVVYEPEPAFAAMLKSEAEDRGVNVTIVTSTMTPRRCEFLGWLLVHPQAPARTIRNLLPKQTSVFLVCSSGGQQEHVASTTARIMAELPPTCRALSIAALCKPEAHIQSILDRNLPELHSHLSRAIVRALGGHVSKEMRAVHVKPVLQIVAHQDSIPENIAEQQSTVVEWDRGTNLPVRIRPIDDQTLFSSTKTYWLAGLSGTLGLSLCEWMIGRGARYLVITSRTPRVSRSWLKRMSSLGATVKILSNDLTDLAQTESLYQDICSVMPPLGGVAQGAMVLVDATFSNMTREDWQTACQPKVQGTIHLDQILHDVDLDFFVCFSSLSAAAGNPGQSNYTAANMFMTSISQQRRRRGLAASVMHISPLLGVGYVSEKTDLAKTNFARTSGYGLHSERDFHQQFAEAVVAGRAGPLEVAMGLRKVCANPDKPPFWFDNPTISHFISHGDARHVAKAVERKESVKTLLLSAETWERVYRVLQDALRPFLCSLFQVPGATEMHDAQFLDLYLDEMGLDSLLAVEIRTWWLNTVGVSLPVMKILSGITVDQLITSGVDGLSPDLVPNVRSGTDEVPHSREVETVDDSNSLEQTTTDTIAMESSDTCPVLDSPDTSDTSQSDTSFPISPASPIGYGFGSPRLLSTDSKLEPVIPQTKPVVERWIELSPSQKMFWFVRTFLDDRTGLNHTGLYRLKGQLRVVDLERAILVLGQRHESLRTCFKSFDDGQPRQGVMGNSRVRLERGHISGADEAKQAFEELRQYSYDIEIGECLRVILLEQSPTVHYLLLGTHTLVLDGFSLKVLMEDLRRSYDGEPDSSSSSSTVCQYPAFAEAQREEIQSGTFESDLQFWVEEFASCPPPLPALSLSSATHHPVQSKYENQMIHLRLDGATKSRVRDLCRHYKTRPFHFFLTAFRALLSRFANVDETAVGIADTNRTHEGALEGLGPYINLVPLRFSNDAKQTFATALRETKHKTDLALSHSRVPFQVLLERLGVHRSATHSPIFQTFFDYRQGMRERQPLGDCELELLEFDASRVPYDVALDVTDDPEHGDYRLMLIVRADMYSKQDAELLLTGYQKLVYAFLSTLDTPFAEPDVFEPHYIERSLQFGRGEVVPSQWECESVLGRIRAVVAANRTQLACKLPQGDQSMTYGEMMSRWRAIANALKTLGATAGSIVAVYQEPTPDWLCSVLAIFSIGAVCVPFDAGTLVERLAVMAEDSKVEILVTDNLVYHQNVMVLTVDGTRTVVNVGQIPILDEPQESTLPPSSVPRAEDAAMILYTSGSTGVPKGIVLRHEGFRNWAEFVPPLYKAGEGPETVLQQSSIGFDMAYLQAFFALCHGGTVCIVPRAKRVDAGAITDMIAAEGVTVTSGVPSEYMNWLRYGNQEALARATQWRTILCGGEPGTNTVLELQALLGPQPPPRFFHMYGPTETSITATSVELFYGRDNAEAPTVGGPFPNYGVYVLDDQLRPVPAGVQGEIYIGGAGVAAGYLGNGSLTAEKFVWDPYAPPSFRARGWSTMHRTGDKGRWHKDGGSLLIEGRRSGDTQHKLRGLRIDLQEVEKVMLKEADRVLSQVTVTVRRTSPDSPEFLVAHAQFHPKYCPLDVQNQQQFLNALSSRLPLPQYMWPAMSVPVQELPMMSSGKLDRRAIAALPLPEAPGHDETQATADSIASLRLTDTEAWLKKMWEKVISKDVASSHQIVPDSDFFHVGGTSMLLLQLQAEIRQKFGLRVPLVQMFTSSSLQSMARLVNQRTEAASQSAPAMIDWDAETDISSQTQAALGTIRASGSHDWRVPAQVVVLTGATGLLGRGLVKRLVSDPSVERVHCIGVRNASGRASDLPLELKNNKVLVHEGDLTLRRLGLSEVKTHHIFGSADRIIHNGADTSHLKTYQSLKRANLQSTKEIVDMCLLVGRRVPIHYVSTASVLQYSGLDEFGEESARAYPPPPDGFDGYSASKWASEVYLCKVHERSATGRWPIWIHRPTSILRQGDSDHDDSQNGRETATLEIVPNLLKYCRMTNAVPVLSNMRGVINIVPLEGVVDSLAHEMSASMPQAGFPLRFLHEMGDVNISLTDLKSHVDAETGKSAVQVPPDEWARRAGQAGMDQMLVAFFENLSNMPAMTWQRLIKKCRVADM